MQMILSSLLIHWRNVPGCLAIEKKVEYKCRTDKCHDLWYRSGPPAEFRLIHMHCTGVGNDSINCNGCKLWVHKKCSGLQGLTPNPDYRWARCRGTAHSIDSRPQSKVHVGPDKLVVVASFCYLGDMLSAGKDCELAVTTRVKRAWKKFRELLPVLTSCHLSYKTHGHLYSSCVRSTMLHAIDQDEPAAPGQVHDQTDLQYQARGCGHSWQRL